MELLALVLGGGVLVRVDSPWACSVDLLFLAFMAAVYLSKPFDHIYGQPAPHVTLAILGQLMWIRLGLMAVLSLRSLDDARFGFMPTREEWRIGVQHFLYFLPIGAALVYVVQPGTIPSASATLVEVRARLGAHILGDSCGWCRWPKSFSFARFCNA